MDSSKKATAEEIAVKIRQLYSKTEEIYEERKIQIWSSPMHSGYDSEQIKVGEKPAPDIEGINDLLKDLPKDLKEHIKKISGAAKDDSRVHW